MKCPECNVQQLQGLTTPLKEGYLQKHKKRVFGKDWKENWFVLYEDSTMAWYKNKEKQEMPLGTLVLKDAPEMLAVGQFTFKVPGLPTLPPGSKYYQLIALGSKTKEVHWLLASSEDELNDWMNAISKTLPVAPSNSKQLKSETIKFKNGKILFYNQEGTNIGTLCASMKPVFKKCKNCCTACDYSTNYHNFKDHADVPFKCGQKQNNTSSKSRQLMCECGTGFLMGHAMASTINGWRGWGEGLGWQIAGLCDADYSAATNAFAYDHTAYITTSHDLGDVDYEPGAHTTNAVSAFSHEVTTVMDSTSESTGLMSFDFLL